jgi:hypothetical protein
MFENVFVDLVATGGEQLPDWVAAMLPGGPADYTKLGTGQWACPK